MDIIFFIVAMIALYFFIIKSDFYNMDDNIKEKDVLILLQMVKEMDELIQAKKEMDLIWALHVENKTCTILESKKARSIGLEYGSRGNVIYSIIEKYYENK